MLAYRNNLEHLLAERFRYQLYSADDEAIAKWLIDLEILGKAKLRLLQRRARARKPTPSAIRKMLQSDDGLAIEIPDGQETQVLLDQIGVSQRRENGIRWIHGNFGGTKNVSAAERFLAGSSFYDDAVEQVRPVFATLVFNQVSLETYDRTVGGSQSPVRAMPVTSYGWRNYLTPEFAQGRLLGDGSEVLGPMAIDTGVLPFAPLVERDRVQRLLAPFLPRRLHDPENVPSELLLDRVQAAEVDCGVELPDDLMEWVRASL